MPFLFEMSCTLIPLHIHIRFLKTLIVVYQTIVVWQRPDAFYSALINSLNNMASDKAQAKEAAEKEDLEDLINLINEKRNGAKVCLHFFGCMLSCLSLPAWDVLLLV